jgi:hypothetical protein
MRFLPNGAAACAFLAAISVAPALAQDAPPLVKQINNGNWLSQSEAEQLVGDLFYNQSVQAYILTLPALNVSGMRDGSEAAFGKGYNVLPIWKERMDSRTWVPTPNADVIYSMSYLDLKKDGPLVVAAPPNVIGMFTDFFQHTIIDVGAVGPGRARGGLYLLLPPGYTGEIPKGYFAFESKTNNVFFLPHHHEAGGQRPGPRASRQDCGTDARLSALDAGEGCEADGLSGRQRQAHQHDVPNRQFLLDEAQGAG